MNIRLTCYKSLPGSSQNTNCFSSQLVRNCAVYRTPLTKIFGKSYNKYCKTLLPFFHIKIHLRLSLSVTNLRCSSSETISRSAQFVENGYQSMYNIILFLIIVSLFKSNHKHSYKISVYSVTPFICAQRRYFLDLRYILSFTVFTSLSPKGYIILTTLQNCQSRSFSRADIDIIHMASKGSS